MNHEEILLNASHITHQPNGAEYEFILNTDLVVMESLILASPHTLKNHVIKADSDMLFELNHVRVNPRRDNSKIIQCLTDALTAIGVDILNPPNSQSMGMCYKPLGEITANVRFYLTRDQKVIFLAPTQRLKLVNS